MTGGLASGKSSIRKDLENLGAATIDCDKMGHKAYEKSTRCYHKLVDVFGRDILDADENIDRKELGKRVFGKHDELAKLQEHLLTGGGTDIFKCFNQISFDLLLDLLWAGGCPPPSCQSVPMLPLCPGLPQ